MLRYAVQYVNTVLYVQAPEAGTSENKESFMLSI